MPLWLSVALWPPLTALGAAVTFLPRFIELPLGRALGHLAMRLDRRRPRIAYDNIRRCLPELGEAGWRRLLEENFAHYGVLVLELMHMFSPFPGHYHRYAVRNSRVEGLENWKRASAKGKGVLFASAHMANWEIMASAGAMACASAGKATTMVTRHLKPEWLHKKMERTRLTTLVHCAIQPRTLPTVMKALRRAESVGFVIDQYAPPPMGEPAPFFGVNVDTLAAVAPLAERTGAAIIPVSAYRDPKGIIHVRFEPELPKAEATTAGLAAKVESWIRARPGQWLWAHRRFKNVVWPAARS